MKSAEIRKAFCDYFSKMEHQVVPSSSLIPGNDSTLLFTNAGMVQFKDTFLGTEPRPYSRAVSVQRCVRAGGKHNDLDNVGYTARHHTFFEMLGNFSFGDYFKEQAIRYAWAFLTEVIKLPKERLWVTVFREDDEAFDIWVNQIGVSPNRISRCGEKDNFWSMGDTGPCGPCTEIFYDHGEEIPGGPPGSPDEDADRYIEIWNLVFMQYNRDKEGVLHPLPKPSVDTGMGLERLAAVVQGVHNNYDTDIFSYLIHEAIKLNPEVNADSPSLKVIADHIRSCSFLIVDGVMPGNEGRGYVLRRIIRRAIRHGHKLGFSSPFFSGLVDPLISVMGDAYPELKEKREIIVKLLNQEENQFARTLDQGLKLLRDELTKLKGQVLDGETAFKLYDTYGFPIDLTADVLREQNYSIDMAGFEACMQQQRQLSQSGSQFDVDYHELSQIAHVSTFHGYDKHDLKSELVDILFNGQPVKSIKAGMKAIIILKDTPFYAESGGQVGDSGFIYLDDSHVFRVDDTQKSGQSILHIGELLSGEMSVGQTVSAQVDMKRRQAIRLNHTATHLLHAALREVVGTHVQQKGSLVDAERARFDFTSLEALTAQQLLDVERLVNDKIRENLLVETHLMSMDEAKKSGAMALFGEKYANDVRVLKMGDFSMELCGGTHAHRTGDIGLFKIIAEFGVASGVRRIDMVTGDYALAYMNEQMSLLQQSAQALKTTPVLLAEKITQLREENKQLERSNTELKTKLAMGAGADSDDQIEKIGQISLLMKRMDGLGMDVLRTTMDRLKNQMQQAVIVLYAIEAEKVSIIAGVSKECVSDTLNAPALIRHLCGKGGGRPDMAQGGGALPDDFENRLESLKSLI